MKIVDNRPVREAEAQAEIDKIKNEEKLKKIKAEEEKPLTVGFITDWRVEDKYYKATTELNKKRPYVFTSELKKDFLREAIFNRNNLRQLIVEPFEPNPTRRNARIEIEVTDGEYMEIQKDFKKSGFTGLGGTGMDTYMRALYYTRACELIEINNEAKLLSDENIIKRTIYSFDGQMNHQLKTLLEQRYSNHPSLKPITISNLNVGIYRQERLNGDMLILAANELFGLK
jgi:hypothetical protein